MMLLCTHGSRKYTERVRCEPARFGHLVTPRGPCPLDQVPHGAIALDNDRYNKCYSEPAFMKALVRVAGYAERVRFAAAPDVVCDAEATLREFERWGPLIRSYDLPVALVLQNGVECMALDWSAFDAVFVGGDDDFKDGPDAAALVREAQSRGKWIHVGRVNTVRRFKHFRALGVDSIDGSGFSKFQNASLKWFDRHTQPQLDLGIL